MITNCVKNTTIYDVIECEYGGSGINRIWNRRDLASLVQRIANSPSRSLDAFQLLTELNEFE